MTELHSSWRQNNNFYYSCKSIEKKHGITLQFFENALHILMSTLLRIQSDLPQTKSQCGLPSKIFWSQMSVMFVNFVYILYILSVLQVFPKLFFHRSFCNKIFKYTYAPEWHHCIWSFCKYLWINLFPFAIYFTDVHF